MFAVHCVLYAIYLLPLNGAAVQIMRNESAFHGAHGVYIAEKKEALSYTAHLGYIA